MAGVREVVVGTLATLVGAALGVGATLYVSDRQTAASVRAEERTRRAEVYTTYLDAAWNYLSAEMAVLRAPDTYCRAWAETANADSKRLCMFWDVSTLAGPHNAYEDAYRDLAVFGSAAALAAADPLHDIVSVDGDAMPYSPTTAAFAEDPSYDNQEGVSNAYAAAERAFVAAMCSEVSTAPDECGQRLGRQATPFATP